MDLWEWIKIGFASIASLLLVFAIGYVSDLTYPVKYLVEPAYKVPGASDPAVDLAALQRSWPSGVGGPSGRTRLQGYMGNIEKAVVPVAAESTAIAAAPAAPEPDLGTLMAAADTTKGEAVAKVCLSCHTFDKGGPNRVGPNLWGVAGRKVASHEGFTYSPGMISHGGNWTFEALNTYLTNPAKAAPGNKMAFAGVRKPEDRANLLAYLRSLSDSPVPLPPPGEKKTEAEPLTRLGSLERGGEAARGD